MQKKTLVDKKKIKVILLEKSIVYLIYTFKNKYNGFFISSVYDIVICNSIKPFEYKVGVIGSRYPYYNTPSTYILYARQFSTNLI